ncbi:MAG: hypothetical protein LBD08_05970, partial [Treponema sp.]|nr:hypothetical protein [Treponema sp.]
MRKRSAFWAACCFAIITASCSSAVDENTAVIHYYRYNGDYTGWNVWIWPADPNGNGEGHEFGKIDKNGFVTASIGLPSTVKEFGYIVRKRA